MIYCGLKPQFSGVIARASNIGMQTGAYTVEMFAADYPQFFKESGECWIPSAMLNALIAQVNSSIQPDKWLESWRYAAGLYLAHLATMYLRTGTPEASATAAQAAASGQVIGTVKSATLGDASVSYDDSAATAGTGDWGILNATSFGQQLASLAKLVGMGGSYVL